MKKIILSGLIAASVMLCANADEEMCPDLSVKATVPDLAKGIKIGLRSLGNIDAVVTDILRRYNNIDDIESYYVKETLDKLSMTPVFNSLMLLKYKSTSTKKVPTLEEEYSRLLNSIIPENKNWCIGVMSEDIRTTFFSVRKL